MYKRQRGSTLIIVLVLLLIITIMGTLAVRQGMTTLNIATSSQASQLLFQSADAPLYRLGAGGYANSSGKANSLLGYALLNQGKEVVFCFRSQTSASLFNASTTSLLTWNSEQSDVTIGGVDGFCNLKTASDFASSRKAQMTQVTIIANPFSSNIATEAFSSVALGTDPESANVTDSKLFRVYVTSIIPALSTATEPQITSCLKRPSEMPLTGNTQTISECLNQINVPFSTKIQDFRLTSCTVSTTNVNTITSCS